MESPLAYPESPLDADEAAYPCKGCGEILEEGKAFELAGNRWHIDCFRCNTCNTLLDSDANLLLLGDGSLICNNCTYSCSNCGNKIEDLAILTGDQAFCATCFKCRNCKKKIENLRYARTSQGIFCMDCHEALMARRRKKTARNTAQRQKATSNNTAHLDKSLPAIPPPDARKTLYSPTSETTPSEISESTTLVPSVRMASHEGQPHQLADRRDPSPAGQNHRKDGLTLPSTTFRNNRQSVISHRSDLSGASGDDFHIPIAFDPTPPIPQPPQFGSSNTPRTLDNSKPQEYFSSRQGSVPAQKDGHSSKPSKNSSPHIAYQEKGRQTSADITDPLRRRREGPGSVSSSLHTSPLVAQENAGVDKGISPPITQTARDTPSQADQFRLQEAPKTKKSTSSQNLKPETTPARLDSANGAFRQPPVSVGQSVREMNSNSETDHDNVTPRASYEYESSQSPEALTEPLKPLQHPVAGALANPPKRGDSLDSSKRSQKIPRKEVNPAANIPQPFSDAANSTKVNGGKTISSPVDSPRSKSIFDSPSAVQSQLDEASGDVPKESFIAPRAPPPLPAYGISRSRDESTSTTQSEAARVAERPASPVLPRYSAGGDFSMEEDMARILGEDGPQESFMKRVSNSVRHGRSFSDKGGRLSRENRWPRSPMNVGAMPLNDFSSPSTGSLENRDDLSWFKNELRREKLKASERDRKIIELEAALESSASIKQVNTELREKRSTMVVLDTQKEMVVRELEVLTDHIAAAKRSGEPLDLGKMNNTVLKEFAESLQKLKQSFAPQIEESTQRRNDLVEEISKLTQAKEKSFQEFEQLSSKNAQLAELNNQLVHQIQGLYRTGAGQTNEQTRGPNGLGIYDPEKDKSQFSIDSRTLTSEMSLPSSNTTLQAAEDAEPATATVVQGPHVVNIRKGQPKKFNWKGKSSNVAKGVTKGLKGAFSSTQQSYTRELQFAESTPYGSTPPGQEYSSLPRNNQEPIKQGFGFFGNQKPPAKPNGMLRTPGNESTPSLLLDAATHLFGSDLEQRAEYEGSSIPTIVTRCIEEVEHRGMDAEGIYRKSGGNSQVQAVKEGFEQSAQDFDLSDPDLDINAVTSCLKQYFRRLPNPLITYEVYDKVLETNAVADTTARVEALARALSDLPRVHWDVLEHLMFHLSRVVERSEENLMTSSNVAVVFAPTIMRPESLSREMTDNAKKNEVVQFLLENCRGVFAA